MKKEKLEIGEIITFEPSDSYEYGVMYRVNKKGKEGMAAFLNICSYIDSLRLRVVSIEDGCVKVRHHYEADVHVGHVDDGTVFEWDEGSHENNLAVMMKIAAMNPDDLAPLYDKRGICFTDSDAPCKKEYERFRKSIYNILVSSNGEWLRKLWPSCPEDFNV